MLQMPKSEQSVPSSAKTKTRGKFPIVELKGPTIQGEGPLFGKQSLLVRFGGCSYRCSWCLSGKAKILTMRNKRVPIKEIATGTDLVAYDPESNSLKSTRVTAVSTRKVKDIWVVSIPLSAGARDKRSREDSTDAGRMMRCSGDHRWRTPRGWIATRDLMQGEMVLTPRSKKKLVSNFCCQIHV